MKNLKLLAASIVAGSLLTSSSQANKIEGAYINLGFGTAEFPMQMGGVSAKTLSATSVVFGAEYIYNYMGIVASIDMDYRFIDLSKIYDVKRKDFEKIYYGLGAHQFLGRLNLGYELTDGFAVFANVGITAQSAEKSKEIVPEKKLLSSFGFVWGFGARYALSKNWSVRGDLGFNNISITKDLKDYFISEGMEGLKSFDYRTTTFTVSYNF